ncbi:ABC transporter permease [Numidum massiliense]|uniref:ABC transporter permease n=1 Tax=Numidum massiliense TaxID=1522315 RepID=UPI0006D57759|nr:ABC transporter permease [Numidum massiliense]
MRWFNLLKANTRKEYIELKRYLPNTIAEVLTFYCIFLAMFYGIKMTGDPKTMDVSIQFTMVSYISWYLAMSIMNFIGWVITNEALRGTLEQLYMSPLGAWRVLMSRLLASTLFHFGIIIALLYLSMATTGQWLSFDVLTILPVLAITLVSMFGVAYIVAGMSIVLKQVQAFLQIFQFILMGLTFVPVGAVKFLVYFPFVQGIDLIRNIMINDVTFSQIPWQDWLTITVNATVYLVIGIFVFRRCERVAMDKGLLAHY